MKKSSPKSEFAKQRKRARKRMHMYQTLFVTLTILLISTWILHAQTPDSAFQEANTSYRQANYQQAIQQYQAILKHQQSAHVQYNLGNAYYKLNDFGPAILHYEKAYMLQPDNPEIQANLKLAQKSAQVPVSHTSWIEQIALLQNINNWVWLGCIAFWLTVGLIILPKLYRWKNPLRHIFVAIFSIITLTSATALWGYHNISKEGIVLHHDTPLKIAPAETSPNKAFLNPGAMGKIIKTHLPYYMIQTPNGKTGWVNEHDFGKIWD